jgi:hypothetical protein
MTTNLFDTTRAKLLLRDILASKRMSPVQATVKRAIDVIVSL